MKMIKRIGAILLILAAIVTLMVPMLPAANAAVSTASYNSRVRAFLNDSRWKNGVTWGSSQKPKLSTYSSTGCCAYAADFVAYVYGSASSAWNTSDFTKYTSVSDIRSGDVIYISGHWLVVLERYGDTFYTAEGSFDGKARVATDGWGIKNGVIYNLKASDGARTFKYGYHYKFSDATSGLAITTGTYTAKVNAFLSDSRWKNGIKWADAQTPKLSKWSSTGCCSYAADFVAYVYGSKTKAWTSSNFTKFTNMNEIRAGDIIHTSNHWFVVLSRNGNTFYTAEGNFSDKTRVTTSGWGIKNGTIYNLKATNGARTFKYGYHYNFLDGAPTSVDVGSSSNSGTTSSTSTMYYSNDSAKMEVMETNATIAQVLHKPTGKTITTYGARLYDEFGNLLASKTATSSGMTNVTEVHQYWDVNEKLGVTLVAGRKYLFDMYSVVGGVTVTSPRHSFVTKGTAEYTVDCYDNYSGKNYFLNSGFTDGLDTDRYSSRDTSVYTLGVDTSVKHDARYNTLKIVGTAAGSSGKDMAFSLSTRASQTYNYCIGDSSEMVLSFWAKSSVNGAKFNVRWGFEAASAVRSVTLTTDWQYYTIRMDRTAVCGSYLHPYFDVAGTFWLSELQMETGTSATAFVPEDGGVTKVSATDGSTYSALPTPTRTGYRFTGWYTSARGGTQVKKADVVLDGNMTLYAHWTPAFITTQPVSSMAYKGDTVTVSVKTAGTGLAYQWYVAEKGSDTFTANPSFRGASYGVPMDASRDGRRVYCVVTDKYGNSVQSDTVTLTMKNRLKITSQPKSVTVVSGSTAKVTVGAQGDGLTYKWYFAEKGSDTFKLTTSFKGSSYSVSMTNARAGRRVYCVITDKYGDSVRTNTVTLNKKTPLKITSQPKSVAVVSGSIAKVTVGVQGDGLTYKWYFAEKGSSTFKLTTSFKSKSYSVSMTTARNGRRVYCVITDKYGDSVRTNTVTLSRKIPLKVTRQPVSVSVVNGATAKITFGVQGEGLTYKWYYADEGVDTFKRTTAFKSNSYSVTMNDIRDGRRVYCLITDKYGNSVRTNVVTLRMK